MSDVKSFSRSLIFIGAVILMMLAAGPAPSQQRKEISVDWIYSKEAAEVSALPSYSWLSDGTAILYDIRQPVGKRTFERLNPQTGQRVPLLDMQKALESLRPLSKGEMPEA